MRDPFKSLRAKTRKKLTRATLSAIANAWTALAAPAKPKTRKISKARSATAKTSTALARANKKAAGTVGKPEVAATPRVTGAASRGAKFVSGTHEGAFGNRSYKLYVPVVATTASERLPLIVMLHGCGQSPQDFATGTGMNRLAEEFGFLVLYPAQSRDANPNGCWNWFRPGDQNRGVGEPALIAEMTCQIIAANKIDPLRVYVAGMSAGASAGLVLATAYPEVYAAVGVHSGLAVGSAHDAMSAATAMQMGSAGRRHENRMPTIIFQGDADKVVRERNARFITLRAVEPYEKLEKTEKSGRVKGGRDYLRTTYRVGRSRPFVEVWIIRGSGHAWSGGIAAASHTEPSGPDASREMVRFFLRHRITKGRRL
jgi:poly(hydroxyalkanoate) depolymerase family esterase